MTKETRVFRALGHVTRLRIVGLLAVRELCVCHLEGALGLSQVAISRHLGVLRAAGLVESRREGLWVHYSLAKSTSELEGVIFAWLRSRLRSDESISEDLARMRSCVDMPRQDVVNMVRR